jgi:phosphoribosylglycinamide formyltransferase-1
MSTTKNNHDASKHCRIVVLISGSGSNLQSLIDGQQQGTLAIDIVAVVSNKADVLGLQRAEKAGIPHHVIDHRDYVDRESFDQQLAITINRYQPELVVLAGFMRILTADFVRAYQGRMLNIHPSLLPKYQGLHTHQRALDAGDDCHGVSVHFVTEELDGGPNIIQAIVPIIQGDDADSLTKRVQQQEHIIYPMAVAWFAEKRLQLRGNHVQLDNETLSSTGYQIDRRQQTPTKEK